MKKYLEFNDDKSQKFWQIEVAGNSHTVTYGKIGTAGQQATKTFGTGQEAMEDAEKLVQQKLKKGYAEVGSPAISAKPGVGHQTRATTVNDIEIFKQHGQSLLDRADEFVFTPKGEKPEYLVHFEGVPESEIWAKVFSKVNWIGSTEGSGGAVGSIKIKGQPYYFWFDSEASFNMMGTTFTDFVGGMLYDEEDQEELQAFLTKHNLPAAINSEDLKVLEKTLKAEKEYPDNYFEELKAKAKKASSKTERDVRPMTRNLSSTFLKDGKIAFVTWEDANARNERLLCSGAIYFFDPQTNTFEHKHDLGKSITGVYELAGGGLQFFTPYGKWNNGEFKSEQAPWRESAFISVYPINNTEAVVKADKQVFLWRNERLTALVNKDDVDFYYLIDMGDHCLVHRGKAIYSIDKESSTLTKVHELPSYASMFKKVENGYIYYADDEFPAYNLYFAENYTGTWTKIGHHEKNQFKGHLTTLKDGRILYLKSDTRELFWWTYANNEFTKTGVLKTNGSFSNMIELEDGRLLFIGGNLYHNIEAEPEFFDLKTGEASCVPGYEKEYARQHKAWVKYREKEDAKSAAR